MVVPAFEVSLLAFLSLVAAVLTILDYLRYVPNVLVMVRSPTAVLSMPDTITSTYCFKRFWSPIVSGEKVVVVFPAKDLDDHREGTATFDHQGLTQLLNELKYYFRDLEIEPIPDDEFGSQHRDYNIISVAGPIPNQVTFDLLYKTDVPFAFQELQTGKIINSIVSADDGVLLEPETYYDDDATDVKCSQDYGIITRVKSPYNADKTVINVAGGYGEGTLAGCQLLKTPSALATLHQKGGDSFQAVYGVSISEGGVLKEPYLLDEHPEWEFETDPIVRL